MPLFQNSTLTVATAQTRIARSGSASDFTAELSRALEALQDAMRWFNRSDLWEFTRTYADTIPVAAGTSTYALPYDCAAIYDVRLTSSPRRLTYINRRPYDSAVYDQSYTGIPYGYDAFRQGAQGMIQLIPTPGQADNLEIKYYRRLWIPCSVSATGVSAGEDEQVLTNTNDGFAGVTVGSAITGTNIPAGTYVTAVETPRSLSISQPTTGIISNGTMTIGGTTKFLDVPSDYEDGIVSRAKEIYLAEREADGSRYQRFALEARAMLERAKANNFRDPDNEIVFLAPSDVGTPPYNPNAVMYDEVY